MARRLLNITVVQAGWKIQLVRELRHKWGQEKTAPGRRIAFYETDDGEVVAEPLD